jgi:hypothetical protein
VLITHKAAVDLAMRYGFNNADALLEVLQRVELLWSLRDADGPEETPLEETPPHGAASPEEILEEILKDDPRKLAKTLQARQRKLTSLRRKYPKNDLVWSAAAEIASGQRTVIFDARTRQITVEASDRNKRARTREDKPLNAVVASLDELWLEHHPSGKPIALTAERLGDSFASSGVEFIMEVLVNYLMDPQTADQGDAEGDDVSPEAIVCRLQRIRAKRNPT